MTVCRLVSHVSIYLSLCVWWALLNHFHLWHKEAVFQRTQLWCPRLNWFEIIWYHWLNSCEDIFVSVEKIQWHWDWCRLYNTRVVGKSFWICWFEVWSASSIVWLIVKTYNVSAQRVHMSYLIMYNKELIVY